MDYKKSFIGSVVAFIIASSCCWLPPLIIALGLGSSFMGIAESSGTISTMSIIAGVGFLVFGSYQYLTNRKKVNNNIYTTLSILTCPKCGFTSEEEMPEDACQYFYKCKNCETMLKPQRGDCCVFCSYGSTPCPPVQMDADCC